MSGACGDTRFPGQLSGTWVFPLASCFTSLPFFKIADQLGCESQSLLTGYEWHWLMDWRVMNNQKVLGLSQGKVVWLKAGREASSTQALQEDSVVQLCCMPHPPPPWPCLPHFSCTRGSMLLTPSLSFVFPSGFTPNLYFFSFFHLFCLFVWSLGDFSHFFFSFSCALSNMFPIYLLSKFYSLGTFLGQ